MKNEVIGIVFELLMLLCAFITYLMNRLIEYREEQNDEE